ncbi:MAG: alpha/beta hydrolase [Xanthomonadaceae bacterium]|nr:alpha/beta hydrolase [Xanthomonadaceae bacterium]
MDIDGIHYNYSEAGDPTNPAILFLHNGGGDHRSWIYQLRDLSQDFHCVALDIVGYGESTRPECAYTVEWMADLTTKFIKKKFDKPISIVGNCIGGSSALELIQNDPTLVSRLTILNTCFGPAGMSGVTKTFYQVLPKNMFLLKIIFNRIETFMQSEGVQKESLSQQFYNLHDSNNEGIEMEKKISIHPLQKRSRRNTILGMKSFAKFSRPFKKDKLTLPIQVIWGKKNTVMSPKLGEWLAGYLGAPFYFMNKSFHMPMSEEPIEFNKLIRQLHT